MDHTRRDYEPQAFPHHLPQLTAATAPPDLYDAAEPPARGAAANHQHAASHPPTPNLFFPSSATAAATSENPHHLHNAAGRLPHPAHFQHSITVAPPPSFDTLLSSSSAATATASQRTYHPYFQSPNPDPRVDAAARVSSCLCEAPHGGGTLQTPPMADARLSALYGLHTWCYGRVARHAYYPPGPVGAALRRRDLAGGDARVFSAEGCVGEYRVDPVAYENIPGRPPIFSSHFNDVTPGKKKKIVKVTQSAYCKVCKVKCSSQEVLNSHRQGKKHKKKLKKLKESFVPKPVVALITPSENKEGPQARKEKTACEPTRKGSAPTDTVDLETKKRRLLEEGAAVDAMRVCTICNIVCNSELVFKFHIAGQKHAAKVKKQAAPVSIG